MSTAALAALLLAAPFRLPTSGDFTRPSHYDLKLRVIPADAAFSGEETIQLDVQGHPAEVILHAADLTIGEARIEQGGKSQVALVVMHADSETVALQPPLPLAPGPARLHLIYSAKLRDDLRGLSRSRRNRATLTPCRSSRPPTPAAPSPATTSQPSRPPSP